MAHDGTIKINTELDSSKAQKAMSSFSDVAKKSIGVAVKASVATATAALGALAGYSVKVGMSFEEGMSKVSAISGATGEDLTALTEKAKEMGAKTKFSATEAASAFEYMAMAGWKTEDMLSGIEGIMNLAAASGEQLGATSDIVTDALTAFGLTAKDSAHFADVMAAASSNANTNVSMLGETFKYVAPVAGSLGFSAEDTAVAIGLMANSGIKASQAGTSLRAIMSRMAKPTDAVQAAMDKLGISLTDSNGKMKTLDEVMMDLRKGFADLGEAEKAQMAASIGGQEAMSALLSIVNAGDADVAKLKDAIYNCDGATAQMADTMQNNLKGSLTIMGSAAEGFGIQIFESMQEPLRKAVEEGTVCIDRLSKAFSKDGFKGAVREAGDIFDELTDKLADSSEAAAQIINPIKDMSKNVLSLGKKVLPVATKALSGVAKNLDVLVPVITASVVGFKAFNVIGAITTKVTKAHSAATAVLNTLEKKNCITLMALNGGLTVRQLLVGVMNGQISISTALTGLWTKAQIGLNAALNANPIGIVVTSMIALVTAGYAVNKMYEKQTEAEKQHTKELKASKKAAEEHLEKVKEREEAYDNLRKEQDDQAGAELTQLNNLQKLNAELTTLVDENGKVKKGEEGRASFITSELSNALGMEINMTNGQIENYKSLQNEIVKNIQQKRIDAVLTSAQAKYEEAVNNQLAAAAEATEALTKKKKAQALVDAEIAELKNLQMQQDQAVIDGNKALVGVLNAKIKKQKEDIKLAEEEYDAAEEAYETSRDTLAKYANDIDAYTALAEAAASGNAEEIEAAIVRLTSNIKTANNATEEELREQVAFNRQLEADIKREVEKGTPGYTQAMLEQARQATQAALDEFYKKTGEIYDAGNQNGSSYGEGFKQGIQNHFPAIIDVGKLAGDKAYFATKNTLMIESPSKKSKKLGKHYDEGFADGVEENADLAVKATEKMSEDTLNAIDLDSLSARIKDVDIPGVMMRIDMAANYKNAKVADNVVSAVSASESLAWKQQDVTTHLSEGDIKQLAKAFSGEVSRDISQAFENMVMAANDRELFRVIRKVK